jgi:hypothetical protein
VTQLDIFEISQNNHQLMAAAIHKPFALFAKLKKD